MTCVVGLVGAKGVTLWADSQSSGSNLRRLDHDPKVYQLSDVMAIGYTGSGRFGQILKYWLMDSLEDAPSDRDLKRWYVREFVDELRSVLSDQGHLHIMEEDQTEHMGESLFLLAMRDRLFTVESDFSINESLNPFEAVGSGGETATGAIHAAWEKMQKPAVIPDRKHEELAVNAINAAIETTLYVGGPINNVSTVYYTVEEKKLAKRMISNGRTVREEDEEN